MPLPNSRFQNIVATCKQVFDLLHRISSGSVAGLNSAFMLDTPLATLLRDLSSAADLARTEEDPSEDEFLDLRAAIMDLCGDSGISGRSCYLENHRDSASFAKKLKAAESRARRAGLLDLNVSGRRTTTRTKGSVVSGSKTTRSEPQLEKCDPRYDRVYSAYKKALEENPELQGKQDLEIYAYIKEHVWEREDGQMPSPDTFMRYLRGARAARGDQKNRSRRGRRGRSIAPQNDT